MTRSVPRPDDPPAERRRQGRRASGPSGGPPPRSTSSELDLDAASAEAEVELLDPAARPPPTATAAASRPRPARRSPRRPRIVPAIVPRRRSPRPGPRRPCRGSSTTTGAFGSLRERLGPAGEAPGMHGRHVGLTSVPARRQVVPRRGPRARAGRRSGSAGSRATPRSATGSPRSWARGSATPRWSPSSSRGPRSPTSAASSSPDETAARVAALAAWRAGAARVLVASVQALLQAPSRPTTCPAAAADAPARRRGSAWSAPRRALRARLRAGPRGRRPGRVRAPRRHRRRVPAVARRCPIRIEFFGDEIDSLRAFDPTDQRSVGTVRSWPSCRRPSSCCRPAARTRSGRGSAGWRATLPERLARRPRAVRGRRRDPERPARGRGPGAAPRATRRRSGRGSSRPSTGLDHLDPATLLVLDEPGDLADAADFLWRQADERHAEMVEAGDLPKDWPSAYLPPRDWKARLHGARTLELTWQSEAVARRAWPSPRRA